MNLGRHTINTYLQNKSVFSFRRDTALAAGSTAANPPQRRAGVDRWDRRPDRQTNGHLTVSQTLPILRVVSIK